MQKLLCLSLVVTIIFSACKQKNDEANNSLGNDGSGQCILGDCENGVGIFYFAESTKWVGDEFGEKPYVIEACRYIGEWKDRRRNGIGTSISYDETGSISDIYIGEWEDDMKQGEGTYIYADGTIKKGLWENGEFLGE